MLFPSSDSYQKLTPDLPVVIDIGIIVVCCLLVVFFGHAFGGAFVRVERMPLREPEVVVLKQVVVWYHMPLQREVVGVSLVVSGRVFAFFFLMLNLQYVVSHLTLN